MEHLAQAEHDGHGDEAVVVQLGHGIGRQMGRFGQLALFILFLISKIQSLSYLTVMGLLLWMQGKTNAYNFTGYILPQSFENRNRIQTYFAVIRQKVSNGSVISVKKSQTVRCWADSPGKCM